MFETKHIQLFKAMLNPSHCLQSSVFLLPDVIIKEKEAVLTNSLNSTLLITMFLLLSVETHKLLAWKRCLLFVEK